MSAVRNLVFATAIGFGGLGGAPISPATAEMTVEVGGAPMYPSKNIIETRSIRRTTRRWLLPSRRQALSKPWKATGLSPSSRQSTKPLRSFQRAPLKSF